MICCRIRRMDRTRRTDGTFDNEYPDKACPQCGVKIKHRKQAHCSHACASAAGRPKGPVPIEFWGRVDKRAQEPCWVWTGSKTNIGYGQTWTKQGARLAHREAYARAKGPIPDGSIVRHTCDNRLCVNPDHLLVGSLSDNTQDMISRGRNNPPKGARNGMSKITDDIAREIRKLAPSFYGRYRELAAHFGISIMTISNVATGKTWKHVTD
jgi:hypothetical protein